MKTFSKIGLMIALAGSLFLSSCAGTYYVNERPAEPVYVRPAVPYQGAVWVEGEWVWNGGQYRYVNGYWARPRAGRAYVRGHWEQRGRGYVWFRGHWG